MTTIIPLPLGNTFDITFPVQGNGSIISPFPDMDIITPKDMSFKDMVFETLDIYKKLPDCSCKDDKLGKLKQIFFYHLRFETKNYFAITDQFFRILSTQNRMSLYIENKKLIDYIIGITAMMKELDALIKDFYLMSTPSPSAGETKSMHAMLQDVLVDMEKFQTTLDAKMFINKTYILAININSNLENFYHLIDKTSDDILSIVIQSCI